jgi:hypothetical protein
MVARIMIRGTPLGSQKPRNCAGKGPVAKPRSPVIRDLQLPHRNLNGFFLFTIVWQPHGSRPLTSGDDCDGAPVTVLR